MYKYNYNIINLLSPPLVSFTTKKNLYRYIEIKPRRTRASEILNFNYLLVSDLDY